MVKGQPPITALLTPSRRPIAEPTPHPMPPPSAG
jgi:hypothetical protein